MSAVTAGRSERRRSTTAGGSRRRRTAPTCRRSGHRGAGASRVADDVRDEIMRLGGRRRCAASLPTGAMLTEARRRLRRATANATRCASCARCTGRAPDAAARARARRPRALPPRPLPGRGRRSSRPSPSLTGSVEQHPVLMDCDRAQGAGAKVEELWEELAAASPSAALVTEGRIVAAGALADRGRLRRRHRAARRRERARAATPEHHLRLWYALADLDERAGDLPRARALFERVRAGRRRVRRRRRAPRRARSGHQRSHASTCCHTPRYRRGHARPASPRPPTAATAGKSIARSSMTVNLSRRPR